MSTEQSEPTLEQVAYHEAGHAIMLLVCGRRFKRVSLKDRFVEEELKGTEFPDIAAELPANDAAGYLMADVMICAAGVAAEQLKTGRRAPLGSDDRTQEWAANLMVRPCGGPEVPRFDKCPTEGEWREAVSFLEWMRLRTTNVLRRREVWEGVRDVAEKLQKVEEQELDYSETKRIRETARARVVARNRAGGGTVVSDKNGKFICRLEEDDAGNSTSE